MSNAYRPHFASPRQYLASAASVQEWIAIRVDPAQVGGVEVHTTPNKVRLSHAAHRRGEIIVHRTFSLELELGTKHFGMSRAGQARSTRNSILYAEKIDLLAVYERSPSLISSVPPFIR
jgi:hypothetical protein